MVFKRESACHLSASFWHAPEKPLNPLGGSSDTGVMNDNDLDSEVAALLAECQQVGPSEIIPDGEFTPTTDERF